MDLKPVYMLITILLSPFSAIGGDLTVTDVTEFFKSQPHQVCYWYEPLEAESYRPNHRHWFATLRLDPDSATGQTQSRTILLESALMVDDVIFYFYVPAGGGNIPRYRWPVHRPLTTKCTEAPMASSEAQAAEVNLRLTDYSRTYGDYLTIQDHMAVDIEDMNAGFMAGGGCVGFGIRALQSDKDWVKYAIGGPLLVLGAEQLYRGFKGLVRHIGHRKTEKALESKLKVGE